MDLSGEIEKRTRERKSGGARSVSFTAHTDTSSFRSCKSFRRPNAIAGCYVDRMLDHSCSPYGARYTPISFASSSAQPIRRMQFSAWSFGKSETEVLFVDSEEIFRDQVERPISVLIIRLWKIKVFMKHWRTSVRLTFARAPKDLRSMLLQF